MLRDPDRLQRPRVFNLRKGLPIGMITWGLAAISGASISMLSKELRDRFTKPPEAFKEWHIDPESYRLADVAERVKQFMFDENYQQAAQADPNLDTSAFIVAGFSASERHAEEYLIKLSPSGAEGPSPVRSSEETGVAWSGQPEAISRLMNGYAPGLGDVFEKRLGVDKANVEPALDVIKQELEAPLVNPSMPFQDAIDLADFLVDLSIKYHRFVPGAPTVGGPIEVAAISKHEGFRWVKRKFYYDARLNPEEVN